MVSTTVQWSYLHLSNKSSETQLEDFEVKDYDSLLRYFPGNDYDWVYYAPITENTRRLMELVGNELGIQYERIYEYNNSAEMQLDMEQHCRGSCFAINFQSLPDLGSGSGIKYSLSSNRVRSSPKKRFVNDDEINHQKNDDEYIREGFFTLQHVVDLQYMRYQQLDPRYELLVNVIPNLELGPADSYRLVNFGTLFSILFKLLLLGTFLVPLVEEKQNGINEFLNLVTPMSFLNGLSFFILRILLYGCFLVINLTIAWQYGALGSIHFIYIFTLYFLYIIATMSYSYLISVCFFSVFYAKIGGLILLIIPYVFSIVSGWITNLAFKLFSTNAFLEGVNVLQTFCNKHRNFELSDLTRVIKDDFSSILTVYLTLICQTIFYALLYNYLVCVFPGPGGLKRPFLFFLKPETYKKRHRNEYTTAPRGANAIIIKNLCKKFKTSKRETHIADHLDMTISNKEITVLLGHNGAGKTTMMNMIMGLDIESRREFWDILLELRKEKAILVTTHYMEEAEELGDTICILSNGRLERTGSPLELKRKWGNGYCLKLETHENFNKDDILSEIRNFIENASVENIVKPTLYIRLPYDCVLKYHDMLRSLEGAKDRLGIITISVADTSLESVFLNCAGGADQVDTPDGTRNSESALIHPYKRLKNIEPRFWQLVAAIFYKKLTFLSKEWRYTVCMLCISMLGIVFAVLLMHYMSVVNNEYALPLKLAQLRTGSVYIYNPSGFDTQFEQHLRQYIQNSGLNAKTLVVRGNFTINEELKQMQRDNMAEFLEDTIGLIKISGASRTTDEKPSIVIYWASNRYHSSIILLNMLDTCMLQQLDGEAKSFIDASYVPIRRFVSDVSSARLEYFAVIVTAANFFYMFYFIALPFGEHVNGFRQLQPMSRFTYWWATFVFDSLLHGIVCLTLFLIQQLIMPDELYKVEQQKLIAWSIFLYGCSYLPILYVLGNNFKSISTISTYLLLMFIVSEIAPLITSGNIQAMKLHETKIAFLCFLPDFNLNHQLRIINENLLTQRKKSSLAPPSTGVFFAYALVVLFLVMCFFTIVLENKYYRRQLIDFFHGKSCKIPPKAGIGSPQQEMETINDCITNNSHDYPLIVRNLHKSYAGKPAVCGISFAAKPGECFGLLGVNGAGKTTTFQMITANEILDSGHIRIKGIDIRQNEVLYRQQFGYCPQYDALNQFMTAEQCLRLMALLRGLSLRTEDGGRAVKNNVEYWLMKMDLVKYRHVAVKNYSGGTKRKLLAAMALIGEPSLVLLDEPTTGVDPISRRFLWKCVKDLQTESRAVVLTSHSMDECEELCNRLAIMANGEFKCLDNICALKRLSGFTIKLKIRIDMDTETNINTITNMLKQQF
ncbi:hypothetical protein AWZ03_014258, partial [Drosophila navojoa]